ncbi:MAG: NAD-dependent epimerase/dehydratase family protein [Planctomycetota bacterium]
MILVTGGAGFIGSAIVAELNRQRHRRHFNCGHSRQGRAVEEPAEPVVYGLYGSGRFFRDGFRYGFAD